jgi:hypothetical protein
VPTLAEFLIGLAMVMGGSMVSGAAIALDALEGPRRTWFLLEGFGIAVLVVGLVALRWAGRKREGVVVG